MSIDQRKHERYVPLQYPDRKLFLFAGNRCWDVQAIWDISPFGIGLQIDGDVDKHAEVRLQYQFEGVDLRVRGSVIWTTAIKKRRDITEAPCSYRVGISLQPKDTEANVQFFRFMIGQPDE